MALVDVQMPSLGEQAKEIVFRSWMKNIGEQVHVGEPVFKVAMTTEKKVLKRPLVAEVEVISQSEGVLIETRFEKEQLITVGSIAGILDTEATPTVKRKKSWFVRMFGLDN